MRFVRLSLAKRSKLLQCFSEDVPASVAARLVMVNRKTANAWYAELRSRVLVGVTNLPPLGNASRFSAYHERRIARFNGICVQSRRVFLLESRLRYQLKGAFRSVLLDTSSDLLD